VHQVAVLALEGFVPFDLGIPCEVFGTVRTRKGKPAYRVRVCAEKAEVRSSAFRLRAPWRLDELINSDTVVIPGVADASLPRSKAVLAAIREAWSRGARIASICSGAFVLAETGLLDGRRATTHWIGTAELARRFPEIDVDPNVLFVDEGRIVTSAGAAAGLDMCLHLVRRDHGQAIAAQAARLAVSPLDRDGGQAQFIRREPPASRASLAPLLEWMLKNLARPLDVESLAAHAHMSPRTLARRFRHQTGTTPIEWLRAARVRRAQEVLETGALTIEEVAATCGFQSPVTFRARFQRGVGLSPSAYRSRFSGSKSAESASPSRGSRTRRPSDERRERNASRRG
jgi:transcriptional regulator GlxA family with amidase domain